MIVLLFVAGAGFYAWRQRQPAAADGVLTLYGNVDIREVKAAFDASGRVAEIRVQEGERVRRGQLLALLDDTRHAAALGQAKAQVEYQQQVLDKLLAGSRPQEIAQSRASMQAWQATYRNQEANFRRYVELATRQLASIQQRDDARAAFEASRQQYEAARQAYQLALLGPRVEDIAAARAAHAAAVAALVLARRQFDDTRLYAPADGVVQERILEPGDMAAPNVPALTLALPSPRWVRAYVPEILLGRLRPGMAASVLTDSDPQHPVPGWVGYLSPTAEFTPKTVETAELRTALVYQLRVYVCDPQDRLRLGMPATVRIELDRPPATAPGCGPEAADGG